jgi:hypothetical protein
MSTFSKTLRMGVLSAAALAATVGFVAGGRVSHAQAQPSFTDADYVGIWEWMFQGKSFATMVIQKHWDHFSGSLTGVSIQMDDSGKLTKAVATNGPSSTLQMFFANGVLHVSEKDGDDEIKWTMTLTSPKTGELRFAGGAPANAEPIRLEKLWPEPPVQP